MPIQLNKQQALVQMRRLNQVRPELRAAYSVALGRWIGDPKLMQLGLPLVIEGYRTDAVQAAYFAQGRQTPYQIHQLRQAAGLADITAAEVGRIITYQSAGHSNHNKLPSWAIDVALLQANGEVKWDAGALLLFARLMRAANRRIVWGGDWDSDGRTDDERLHDWPHFEFTA
jgi:peptidoglycan L-alanyl-D-glutamate endopeptidase CwlK